MSSNTPRAASNSTARAAVEAAQDSLWKATQAESAARKAWAAINLARPSAVYDAVRAAVSARDKAYETLHAAQDVARAEVAAERGWTLAKRFKVAELLRGRRGGGRGAGRYYKYQPDPATACDAGALDHEEWLTLDQKPIAIITHSYCSFEQVEAFAKSEGLLAERLDWSWYNPNTIAVVLTAAPQEQQTDLLGAGEAKGEKPCLT